MKNGTYTATHSSLYWKVHAVHYNGDTKVKLKMTVYYKSNDEVCHWLCPVGKAKNFKLLKSATDHWKPYIKD